MRTTSSSSYVTRKLGKRLAGSLRMGDIVCVSGCLGAGKTVLVKGIAEGLGIPADRIISPTFVLLREYRDSTIPLYHFDLYRLEAMAEINALGIEEFFWSDGITVVEWPERLQALLPGERLAVDLAVTGRNERRIAFQAFGQRYKRLLKEFHENTRT